MLNENIRSLRKTKGLSQEELAIKLNVVRQTVSKWEKGLSVPDSSMLISLAEELNTSVSTLLGETVQEECLNEGNLKNISEKLEIINLQLAKKSEMRIRTIRYLLISVCAIIVVVYIAFAAMNSEYLTWDFNNPELAIAGTLLHAQAIRMRKMSEEGKLTPEAIEAIMLEEKPNQKERIVLRGDRFKELFPKDLPVSKREDFVAAAMEYYGRYLSRKERDNER